MTELETLHDRRDRATADEPTPDPPAPDEPTDDAEAPDAAGGRPRSP